MLLIETKLLPDKSLEFPGYRWYGKNRSFINRQAKVGSGGVGILIKNEVAQHYYITISDANFDGILSLKLVNKQTTKQMSITACYLPPERSQYGRNTRAFFDHLLGLSYQTTEFETVVVAGDFNGRIGAALDYIPEIDCIPKRQVLDSNTNAHGEALLEFLKEGKLCVVNGRVTPNYDNFTSISGRGKAVVDYILTPHSNLEQITKCEVISVKELCEKIEYKPSCKLPDHSIVYCELNIYLCDSMRIEVKEPSANRFKRVKAKDIPIDFMLSPECQRLVTETIHRIEQDMHNQLDVDQCYQQVLQIYQEETDRKIPKIANRPGNRKKFRPKPWWNANLSDKWKEVAVAEKQFLKCNGNRKERWSERNHYKTLLKQFDREYNKSRRKYFANQGAEIEALQDQNPQEFWKKLKNLGPTKVKDTIPMEILKNDGTSNFEANDILDKWAHDFDQLYKGNGEFDEEFFKNIKSAKEEFDAYAEQMVGPEVQHAELMDTKITRMEVLKAIQKCKFNKATGFDEIQNEVLKNQYSVPLLQKIFDSCFQGGIIPSPWRKSLINQS